MKRKRISAVSRKRQPADLSSFIHRADDVIVPRKRVFLFARKSPMNPNDHSCEHQLKVLEGYVLDRNAIIADRIGVTWPGSDPYWIGSEIRAKGITSDDVILFETSDRVIRSRWYSKKSQHWLPSVSELNLLKTIVGDVPIATLADPSSTPGENRSVQTKRGQSASSKSPGRPKMRRPGDMKRRRLELKPKAIRLYTQELWTISKISAELAMPRSTVGNWVNGLKPRF